jgi:hypothetical protein
LTATFDIGRLQKLGSQESLYIVASDVLGRTVAASLPGEASSFLTSAEQIAMLGHEPSDD